MYLKNDFEEAIKNFTIAISLDSNKADFYHNRAFAYRKKKNYELAITDYTLAIGIINKIINLFIKNFDFTRYGSISLQSLFQQSVLLR